MIFPSKSIIGIDIGTHSIKAAELNISRNKVTLNKFGIFPTPIEAVSAGEFTELSGVSESIKNLVQEMGTKRKSAAVGLFGSSIVVKRISIPEMEKKLVAEQIRWEAEQYIPFDLQEVNVDYHIFENSVPGSGLMDVLLIAARHPQIVKMVEITEGAGFHCTHLDVSGIALSNCFLNNYDIQSSDVVALLNIGANYTNFVVLHGQEVVFCRDIPIGGVIYSLEIQKMMNIDFEEAEAMKLNVGIGGGVPSELSQALESSHEILCDEILGSIEFFVNTAKDLNINQCYITGGASKTPGLIDFLSRALGVGNLIAFDPFYGISYNKKNLSDEFVSEIRDFAALSMGLGLRKVGDS